MAAAWVGALAAAPAALAGPPIDPHAVTSQPRTDGVVLEGYAVGVPVTVQVLRGGIVIANSLPIVPVVDDGSTLAEINAVDGVTGGCWQDTTPNITHGDVIRVTQNGVSEDATVQNITVGGPVDADPGVVTVEGTATSPTGQALLATGIQQLLVNPAFTGGQPFRRTPDDGNVLPTPPVGGWTATFSGLNTDDHQAALGAQSIATWTTAAGTEATEVEFNPAAVGGPQASCTAPGVDEGVTITSPPAFRYDSTSLTVTGVATGDAASVSITIEDANPFTADVTTPPASVQTFGGGKVWSIPIAGSAILPLTDGQLTVTPTFNPGLPTQRVGTTRTLIKNMVVPDTTAPTATITAGPKAFTRLTTAIFDLTSSEPGTFQCRLDAAAFAGCAARASLVGLREGTHTFAVRAIDTAGNVGPETIRTWQVDVTKPRVRSIVSAAQRRVFAATGRLVVATTCNERCTATVVTKVIMPGVTPRQARSTRIQAVNAGRTGLTRMALTARQLAALRRSLGAGNAVQVAITTTAVDRAGNRRVTSSRINVIAALLR